MTTSERLRRALAVGTFALFPGVMLAQQLGLDAGTRIRVRSLTNGSTLIGPYAGRDKDSIGVARPALMTVSARVTSIAISDIRSIERSVGRESYGFIGAGVGLFAGLAVAMRRDEDVECHPTSADPLCIGQSATQGVTSLLSFIAIAGAGVGLGALIGSSITSERWAAIDIERTGHASFVRAYVRGRKIGVSITM